MTRLPSGAALLLSAVWTAAIAPSAAAIDGVSAAVTAPSASAEELVHQAIEAAVAGEGARRDELLSQAIAVDPDYAPARWQSGQVQFEGKWKTLDEVGQRVANDPRWRQYVQLRQASGNLPADHLELARWCMREGLENEERYHWSHVLTADPSHELARARLRLQEYQGGLHTAEQIADLERRRDEAQQGLATFTPIFVDLCRRAQVDSADGASALEELSRVSDPRAITALEYVVRRESESASDKASLDLHLALINAIANVRDHSATLKLLDYSVLSPAPEVRTLAAASLKSRPVTDYVPLLLAALTSPIKADFATLQSPDGRIMNIQMFFQAGPESAKVLFREGDFGVNAPANAEGRRGPVQTAVRANRQLAATQAYHARMQVAVANAQAEARNERIRDVLRTALNIDYGVEPKDYWDQWYSYNELYEEDYPVYDYYDSYSYVYYLPPPAVTPPPGSRSCFAAGTLVWTQAGPLPIEEITPGDIVLSQNPVTGELAYRAVRQTTVRPPGRMTRLSVGDEKVCATYGHRFWVVGKGWEMAKFLDETWLHALDGPEGVSLVEPSSPEQAYNLVVDDFHTYFVGESRLLVHDNSCPRPVDATIPGAK